MSRTIKISNDDIAKIQQEFFDLLRKFRVSDGKLSYTKTFNSIQRKATVYFSEIAWLKMQSLIRDFDNEVAWHGTARRGDDPDKDEYIISDILVYPQEVTGATVTTDQQRYQMWLYENDDDVFNNIRMQGHSHVNMGVSPSAVDIEMYENILNQLNDDMFYIFMIYNKRGDKTVKIYDYQKNILFETADCEIKIMDDSFGLQKFISDAKEMVKTKQYNVKNIANASKSSTDKKSTTSDQKAEKRKGKRKQEGSTTCWEYHRGILEDYVSDDDYKDDDDYTDLWGDRFPWRSYEREY